MPVTIKDVEKVADLAKIRLNTSEKQRLAKQLDAIIKYVAKISELDLTDVPPSPGVSEIKNVLRNDELKSWLTPEEALMNAPARHDGFFSVPKVIRKST